MMGWAIVVMARVRVRMGRAVGVERCIVCCLSGRGGEVDTEVMLEFGERWTSDEELSSEEGSWCQIETLKLDVEWKV